eukprot:INCI9835.1.p1 GENE.INCI9835.1~~INCI9835.1.p1  ORF type:complete len:551 (-),score=107.42 INCI9835.1:135-1787(-)
MDFFSNTNDALFDTVMESTSTSASLSGASTKPRWQRKQEALLKSQREPLSPRTGLDNTPSKNSGSKSVSVTQTGSKGKTASAPTADRFIANRAGMEMGHAQWKLSKAAATEAEQSASAGDAASVAAAETASHAKEVASKLLGSSAGASKSADGMQSNILGFKKKAPAAPAGYHESIRVLYSKSNAVSPSARAKAAAAQPKRVVATTAERVLDAPELRDDYYLNLLDWNKSNVLRIALNQTVYMWNASTQGIAELCTLETGYISSLRWIEQGSNVIALGTSTGMVELWDVCKMKCLRRMDGHVSNSRIGVLSWNKHVLTSGGQDTQIVNHDVRTREHVACRFKGHTQEVCGMTWNAGGELLASGGNDNLVALWDIRNTNGTGIQTGGAEIAPMFECREHVSAVKALAWSPHQHNVLATGGGTADKCIRTWNSVNGQCLNTINTGSQVTQLLWNPNAKELLSAHGYSENQLTLWSYPRMQKIADLTGHTSRILSLACSPSTGMVCSAGADETLRFWNVFGGRSRAGKDSAKKAAYQPPVGSRQQYTTRLSIR